MPKGDPMPKKDSIPKKDPMPGNRQEPKDSQAYRESLDILYEMATLMNIRLTYSQLAICTSLIENGVNPEALASVVNVLMAEHPENETKPEGSA